MVMSDDMFHAQNFDHLGSEAIEGEIIEASWIY
jgi:hypothetical protein